MLWTCRWKMFWVFFSNKYNISICLYNSVQAKPLFLWENWKIRSCAIVSSDLNTYLSRQDDWYYLKDESHTSEWKNDIYKMVIIRVGMEYSLFLTMIWYKTYWFNILELDVKLYIIMHTCVEFEIKLILIFFLFLIHLNSCWII